MKRVKRIADEFFLKEGFPTPPLKISQLADVIHKHNWELYTYAQGTAEIKRLDLEEYHYTCDAFAYQSPQEGIKIFVNDNLGYVEKVHALCHEIGHIVLLHTSCGILGKNKNPVIANTQEREAEAFALELQAPGFVLCREHLTSVRKIVDAGLLPKQGARIQYHSYLRHLRINDRPKYYKHLAKRFVPLVLILSSVITLGVLLQYHAKTANNHIPLQGNTQMSPEEKASDTEVYITSNGTKYHRPSCRHAKNRDTIKITLSEALKMGYEPCKDCQP